MDALLQCSSCEYHVPTPAQIGGGYDDRGTSVCGRNAAGATRLFACRPSSACSLPFACPVRVRVLCYVPAGTRVNDNDHDHDVPLHNSNVAHGRRTVVPPTARRRTKRRIGRCRARRTMRTTPCAVCARSAEPGSSDDAPS